MAKRQQLETFIAKNKVGANTASQARSKSKQLERLNVTVIERAERTVRMKEPQVEARSGPALRCGDMSIGYGEPCVSSNIAADIQHGTRGALARDSVQLTFTFLRTVA